MNKLLEPRAIADAIHWLLTLPAHVNEIMIRPTGQIYPRSNLWHGVSKLSRLSYPKRP